MISWDISVIDRVDSTQDIARERAAGGAPEGTVIQAMMQSAGRGRHGNTWESPLGNIYMSFVLRPVCSPDLAGQISFVVALGLSAAIDPYLAPGHVKALKWPNDVLIDGKKCAGILLETQLSQDGLVDTLVVGMGINIHAPPADRIGLQSVCGENRLAVHRFRDEVLHHVNEYYQGWKLVGFDPVRREWLEQAHGLNHKISARLPDRVEKGIFRGLSPDGALVLEASDGTIQEIRAGEVFFGT